MSLRKEKAQPTKKHSDMLYLDEEEVVANIDKKIKMELGRGQAFEEQKEDENVAKKWFNAKIVMVHELASAEIGGQQESISAESHSLFTDGTEGGHCGGPKPVGEMIGGDISGEDQAVAVREVANGVMNTEATMTSNSASSGAAVETTASSGAPLTSLDTITILPAPTPLPAPSPLPVSSPLPTPSPLPAPAAEFKTTKFDVQYQSSEIEHNVSAVNVRWPRYKEKERVEARWNKGAKFYKCVILHINEPDKWGGQVTYVVRYEDDDEVEYSVHPSLMRRIFRVGTGTKMRSCGSCNSCLAPDCGYCTYCLDMRKFGGKGTLRQRCRERRCQNKIVPSDWVDSPGKKRSGKRKPQGKPFPRVNDWVKVNYEDDGGWTYGMVVESLPNENLVDILFEDDDQRLER